jgi:hypothetical protein
MPNWIDGSSLDLVGWKIEPAGEGAIVGQEIFLTGFLDGFVFTTERHLSTAAIVPYEDGYAIDPDLHYSLGVKIEFGEFGITFNPGGYNGGLS